MDADSCCILCVRFYFCRRSCINPEPKFGGAGCPYSDTNYEDCNNPNWGDEGCAVGMALL